jgi:hypothetical protein
VFGTLVLFGATYSSAVWGETQNLAFAQAVAAVAGVDAQLVEVVSVDDITSADDLAPPAPLSPGLSASPPAGGRRRLTAFRGVRVRFAVRVASPKAATTVTSNLSARLAPRSTAASQSYAQFAAVGLLSTSVQSGITLTDTFTAAPPPPAPPPAPPVPKDVSALRQAGLAALVVLPALACTQFWVRRRRAARLARMQVEARAKMEWVYEEQEADATPRAHVPPPTPPPPPSQSSRRPRPSDGSGAAPPLSSSLYSQRSSSHVAPLPEAKPGGWLPGLPQLPYGLPAWGALGAASGAAASSKVGPDDDLAAAAAAAAADAAWAAAQLGRASSARSARAASPAALGGGMPPSSRRASGRYFDYAEGEAPELPVAPRRARRTRKYHLQGFKDLDPELM